MKAVRCSIFLVVCILCSAVTGSDKGMTSLKISITAISYSGSISLEMQNASKLPIRIWTEANTWGAAHWRVLLLRNNQLQTFYQNPNQDFSRNIPSFDELPGGKSLKKVLNINDGEWCGMEGKKVSFQKGDAIIVIYDVPILDPCPGSRIHMVAYESNVWYGVVADYALVK